MQARNIFNKIRISAKLNEISLVPTYVTNSLIPTEYGVTGIKKEKSINEVINNDNSK